MKFYTVKLRENSPAVLEIYLRENQENYSGAHRPCVIICPGGGYTFCGDRDSEPNALALLGEGFQACVLRYTCRIKETAPPIHDEPMRDTAAAIRYVRANAGELGIDPGKVTLLGVSAGAHAAACAEVFWNDGTHIPGGEDGRGRPNGLVLCYPVITGSLTMPCASITNLTGAEGPCAENERYSVEKYVCADTKPMFLWQPVEDKCVPSEHSMYMAQALQKHGVPFELHLYDQGWHGIGLADGEVGSPMPHTASWFPLAVDWLCDIELGGNMKGEAE